MEQAYMTRQGDQDKHRRAADERGDAEAADLDEEEKDREEMKTLVRIKELASLSTPAKMAPVKVVDKERDKQREGAQRLADQMRQRFSNERRTVKLAKNPKAIVKQPGQARAVLKPKVTSVFCAECGKEMQPDDRDVITSRGVGPSTSWCAKCWWKMKTVPPPPKPKLVAAADVQCPPGNAQHLPLQEHQGQGRPVSPDFPPAPPPPPPPPVRSGS